MKKLCGSLVCLLTGSLGLPSSAAEASVHGRSGAAHRFPVADYNRDGWDDLWQALFPLIDFAQPDLDSDHDGRTNYQEMLDFQDPFGGLGLQKPLTAAEAKQARRAEIQEQRAADARRIERFHQLLESKGVLSPAKSRKHQQPSPTPATEPALETSSIHAANLLVLLSDPLFLACDPLIAPAQVIGLEKLSNGQVLLAWQGDADRFYWVQWSDDLVHWRGTGVSPLPTVNGIGTWGQTSTMGKRFYRVTADGLTTMPSDPSGGNGTTTFGGSVTFDSDETVATITPHLPPGSPEPGIDLYINGEYHGSAEKAGSVWTCHIRRHEITRGVHSAYATMTAVSETTPGPDNPAPFSPGVFRTPEATFENDYEGLTGFRATESEIRSGDPGSPESTAFLVEFPYLTAGGQPMSDIDYRLTLRNSDGDVVREWTGTHPGPGPDQLSFDWDGTGTGGSALPFDSYSAEFSMTVPGNLETPEPVVVRNGAATLSALVLYETLQEQTSHSWMLNNLYESFQPEWKDIPSTASWGPWAPLKDGPMALTGQICKIMGGKGTEWKVTFWGTENKNNSAQPWATNGTRPAADFIAGNPFNSYDIGFMMGHGIASEGGTYVKNGQPITLPPQHYFPLVSDPVAAKAVWVKSGQMAKKFGQEGKLKWMFIMTCNYFRVAAHNPVSISEGTPTPTHNIYSPMKQQNTLPFGNGLHVLCGYTTSVNINEELGASLSKGLMHQVNDVVTVTESWRYAWTKSQPEGKLYNARSVFWPECKNDTISGVKNANVTNPAAHGSQADLEEDDSRFP